MQELRGRDGSLACMRYDFCLYIIAEFESAGERGSVKMTIIFTTHEWLDSERFIYKCHS